MTLSITMLYHHAECHYAECYVLVIATLHAVMQSVIYVFAEV
jgi:hypothetical protein